MLEIIPCRNQIDEYVELAQKHGLAFEYNDFFAPGLLDDASGLRERIRDYKSLGRPQGVDTLHGAFYDVLPFSWDSGIREHSIYRMRQSVEIADELGCRGVVFHTNFSPDFLNNEKYRNNWLESMREAITHLLSGSACEIWLENMFDQSPRELADVAALLNGEDRFGICLDIAHMRLVTDRPEDWIRALAPYIRHFHINDTHLKYDEHLALGQGSIDWNEIEDLLEKYGLKDKSRLIEVNGLDKIRESLRYCEKNHIV
ncbi:MAG: sugar phosphate isomerase/epimerase [Lachnospiraceae bacterium]|nr:sugar phosphate isomerase/epimerase [Butyrivibrio sp.]MCM1342239.1 sugar phosphate isomerase/epimerase [Muribaculaceae bacterium]MCM1409186.1 sugar phosphate isomerase/epimerase [Lachnospiraceae bacterium]